MPTDSDMQETIGGHVDVVRTECGGVDGFEEGWIDDPPDLSDLGENGADALAAWSYVTGYANALDMTARELISELGL